MKNLYVILVAGLLLLPSASQGMDQRARYAGQITEQGYGVMDQASLNEVLINAAKNNNFVGVQAAIQAGADVNAVDNQGKTALLFAACYNNLEMVNHLLGARADVNVADNDGITALYLAVSNNNLEMINILLGAGANVNAVNNYGTTALYWAAYWDNLEMVNILLAVDGIEYEMVTNTLTLLQHERVNNPCTARIQEWVDSFDEVLFK